MIIFSTTTYQNDFFKKALKHSFVLLFLTFLNLGANAQCPKCVDDVCNEIAIEYEVTVPNPAPGECTNTAAFFVNFDDDFCTVDGAPNKFANSTLGSTLANGDRVFSVTVLHDKAVASSGMITFTAGADNGCNATTQTFTVNASDSYAKVTYTHGTAGSAIYTSASGPATFDLDVSITYPPNLTCTGSSEETVKPFIGFQGNSWCEGTTGFPLNNTWTYNPSTGGTYTATIQLLQPCAMGVVDFVVGMAETSGSDCFSGGPYSIVIGEGEDFGLLEIDFEEGANNSTVNYTANAALPVELTTFNATANRDKNVLLLWETASELNNEYFQVEYSTDGRNFTSLGTVNGRGTTSSVSSYRFVHDQPVSKLNYYRLKQVDFDGKFEYSNVAVAKLEIDKSLTIVPTIVKDALQVHYQGEESEVVIFNLNGQIVYQAVKNFENGFQEIGVNDLPKGIYFLSVVDQKNSYLQSARFIKQ